jgi:UDP-N-acetylglucosamine 1-carboxyvinyltransferase
MAQHFVVEGGRPLQGTVHPAGNKNAALPMIAATLLADGPSELVNVPRIRDVEIQLALLEALGAAVAWTAPGRVRVDPGGLRDAPLDADLCHRLRASVLLAGPLLARFGQVTLPPPGGDVIGRRRLDTHFLAFERLGAVVDVGDAYRVSARALAGADIFLDEPSVTATENALMAAVRAHGRTVLRNAASEPHVQDLARGLTAMGARITGLGTNVLVIEGVDTLRGTTLEIGPDHIEIGSFIGLAAVTDGDVRIEGVRPADLESILLQFDRLGVRPRLDGATLHVEPSQCDGLVMIFEKMFESRLFFVDKLVGMGARAVLCDPHRVVIAGPSPLRGGVVESPDIRAGMAMLLAALAAEGRSEIHNIRQIDRGYERIDERLRALGASVERVGDPGPVR